MRAVLLCIALLLCAPAVAGAQTAPTATTGVPPATSTAPAPAATTTQTVQINAPGAADDSGPSPAVVGLLVALALAVVVALAWAWLRLTAWEPSWLPRLRHSLGEAGYRFGGTWAQLRDWFSPRHR